MWKKFWADLGADLKNAFIHHWLRVVGFLVAYLGPFVFFVIAYSTEGDSAKKPLVSLPTPTSYDDSPLSCNGFGDFFFLFIFQ